MPLPAPERSDGGTRRLQSELSDMELLHGISAAIIHEEKIEALYEKFVDAAVAIMSSDFATMQMFSPERGESGALQLLAHRGLDDAGVAYWMWVDAEAGSTCGETLRTGSRTIVSDMATDPVTLRRNDRAAFLEGGIHSAQSTPLYSRKGELLGMISTHWKKPHHPSERDLRLFDILARQAADVLERRLAEKALRESEARFRAFVATTSDAVYRMSADWSEMHRLDGRDFIADTSAPSRGWMDRYIHPDDHARTWARINEAIATKSPFDLEHRVFRVDGALGWTRSRAIPLLDESGEILEWFGTATDVTLVKEAEAKKEQALRESQRVVETLQTAFLPSSLPRPAGFRIDAAYLPAEEGARVGGDWYDAVELADGRIMLCVGDVTGHGLSAAVTAGKLRQAAAVAALTATDPTEILGVLNRVLRFQHPGVYATAVLAFVDSDGTELSYASAGHPLPLLVSNGAAQPIGPECGGVMLGVADDLEATTRRVPLPANFVIGFFTDGLTEFARDIAAAEDALRRALASLSRGPAVRDPAGGALRAVLGEARPSDDVVLMLAHRGLPAPERSEDDDGVSPGATRWFHSDDATGVRAARRSLDELIGRLDFDAESAFAARIVLGEALANAVQHAPGMIGVALEPSAEHLAITVIDRGPGMKGAKGRLPLELLDETGRGIFLMQALAERVAVEPAADGGTRVRAVVARRSR